MALVHYATGTPNGLVVWALLKPPAASICGDYLNLVWNSRHCKDELLSDSDSWPLSKYTGLLEVDDCMCRALFWFRLMCLRVMPVYQIITSKPGKQADVGKHIKNKHKSTDSSHKWNFMHRICIFGEDWMKIVGILLKSSLVMICLGGFKHL